MRISGSKSFFHLPNTPSSERDKLVDGPGCAGLHVLVDLLQATPHGKTPAGVGDLGR